MAKENGEGKAYDSNRAKHGENATSKMICAEEVSMASTASNMRSMVCNVAGGVPRTTCSLLSIFIVITGCGGNALRGGLQPMRKSMPIWRDLSSGGAWLASI